MDGRRAGLGFVAGIRDQILAGSVPRVSDRRYPKATSVAALRECGFGRSGADLRGRVDFPVVYGLRSGQPSTGFHDHGVKAS